MNTGKLKSVISLDELCKLFKVETVEDFQDRIGGTMDSCYGAVYSDAIMEGLTKGEAEERAQKAESDELDTVLSDYKNAVISVSERLFGEHHLILSPMKSDTRRYTITPKVSWDESASHIIETINGVGLFRFDSVKEFKKSGPYTGRQSVLSHLHWIASWCEVYGRGKASAMIENKLKY